MNVGNLKSYNQWKDEGFQVQSGSKRIAIDPDTGLSLFGEYQVRKIFTQKDLDNLYWEECESVMDSLEDMSDIYFDNDFRY